MGVFPGHQGLSPPRHLLPGGGRKCAFRIWRWVRRLVGWQWVGRLETGPGLWRAWGPLEAGAQTHTASGLDRRLALVKPSPPRLQVGEKECGAQEYMGGFGGKSVGSWPHPPLLFPFLSLSLSLSLSHTHTPPHTHTHRHRRLMEMSLCPVEESLWWQQGARQWRPA